MRALLAPVCLGLCALVCAADETPKAPAKLDGSWTAVGGSDNGKAVPPGGLDKLMMVVAFKDGSYTVSIMGKEVEKGTYKIDTTKSPATIDMFPVEGKDKGKSQIGIFKIEKHHLTMAVDIGGKTRPTTFAPATGVEVRELKLNK